MTTTPCPVCASPALVKSSAEGQRVRCCRCGEFRLSDVAAAVWQGTSHGKHSLPVARLSGWLRENGGSTLAEKDIAGILELRLPTVGEKADRILRQIARAHPHPGETISHIAADYLEGNLTEEYLGRDVATESALLATGFCVGHGELYFLVSDYLTESRQFLQREPGHFWPGKITPAGWARIHELQQGTGTGASGFVAMWFGAEVRPAFAAISAGIQEAGYQTVRIDQVEHNHKIDDEIIASIRRCKFLVADLTGHRGGVYFEAGFALGLGRPVIWLCREDDLPNVHFDNRQYNMILWQLDRLEELRRRLASRIEATLGRGPER